MPTIGRPKPRCFLALPYSEEFLPVKEAVKKAANISNFRIVSLDDQRPRSAAIQEVLLGELARADCVVADVTGRNPNVFFELGLAQAMGKGLFLLMRSEAENDVPFDLKNLQCFFYEQSPRSLSNLTKSLSKALGDYRRSPSRARLIPGARLSTRFFVDWDRLDRSDFDNLLQEMLAQMGFQRVDWFKDSPEFDLIAELPKKDPDGWEYRELWLVTTGRRMPPDSLLDILRHEPEFLLHRISRYSEHIERVISREGANLPITLLFVLLEGGPKQANLFDLEKTEFKTRRGPYASTLRVRIWDRNYLTGLVQQFPQIGYKYFSDEGRSRLKFRKTPEELYAENVELTTRQAVLIDALEDEKNKRVRAERDAVWKDISFTAAHKIGNPIFAIETNLDPLQLRIEENRTGEAVEVIGSMRSSVEKAKCIVDQFKSLTRAQEIKPVPTLLRPILEDACGIALKMGIICKIDCASNTKVMGDPERLAECFDELVSNATHWLDRSEKKIDVQVIQPAPTPLPQLIDSSKQYVLIRFRDNGTGVPVENKSKIFDAFFTTREHGTGLGLAVVRRIIEGHGGVILEVGVPGEGADFEIYLPLVSDVSEIQSSSTQRHNGKQKE